MTTMLIDSDVIDNRVAREALERIWFKHNCPLPGKRVKLYQRSCGYFSAHRTLNESALLAEHLKTGIRPITLGSGLRAKELK